MKTDDLYVPGAAGEIRQNCLAACVITDAQGYTSLAEGMDPQRLVEFVNSYFKALFGAVLDNGGAVVDVKGDGIVAIWTSDLPDVALRTRVCRGCLQMLDAADSFNQSAPASGLPTRIGVDFGPIALANVGAFARYEYRAIGDTVNTGSRLEQLNKKLGTRLLVSRQVAEGVGEFLFRDLGNFMLRGKRSRLRVLELVAERAKASRRQAELCGTFAAALAAYEAGQIEDALRGFESLRERFPEDGPTRLFLRRCAERKCEIDLGAAAGAKPALAFALY